MSTTPNSFTVTPRSETGMYVADVSNESNARLIAAAPELLEACKAAVAALSQPVQFTQPDQRVFDNRPVEILRGDAKFARETLQAAIDKATKGEAE